MLNHFNWIERKWSSPFFWMIKMRRPNRNRNDCRVLYVNESEGITMLPCKWSSREQRNKSKAEHAFNGARKMFRMRPSEQSVDISISTTDWSVYIYTVSKCYLSECCNIWDARAGHVEAHGDLQEQRKIASSVLTMHVMIVYSMSIAIRYTIDWRPGMCSRLCFFVLVVVHYWEPPVQLAIGNCTEMYWNVNWFL